MIPIFIGHDQRESIAFHVLEQSIIDKCSAPVAIIPLSQRQLRGFDGQRDGTNGFIYSRFLVPELCDYQGFAIYLDSDMLLRDDLLKLWDLRDESKAIQVVKHDYHTKFRRKLIGTPMEAENSSYEKKNQSSMILWNCGHRQNRILTTEYVSEAPGSVLHRFRWLTEDLIGEIPKEWNHLCSEYPYSPEAKLVHFTLGSPCFSHYRKCDYSAEWHKTKEAVDYALDKINLSGVA